jgi:HIV Tat-specific factor 1
MNLLHRKLQEWDDEDGFGPAKTEEDNMNLPNRNSRIVVLKHMFSLKELDEDASLLLDLKEDVRDECSTLGEVTNVVLYDVGVFYYFMILTNHFIVTYSRNRKGS